MKLKLQRQVQALRIASDTILDKYQKYYGFIYSDKSNEIFNDKIEDYDEAFWKNYNLIQPEVELINALKTFKEQNLVITND